MNFQKIMLDDIDLFLFDFDGVLTDNLVYINQDGIESVACSRADGLAIDVLRKCKKLVYIISTEKNSVITSRAKKLKIKAIQGVQNKVKVLESLIEEGNFDINKIMYVGNDLNDFEVMSKIKYAACPADSHPKIQKISTFVLKTKGGRGVIREILEEIFELDLVHILYKK